MDQENKLHDAVCRREDSAEDIHDPVCDDTGKGGSEVNKRLALLWRIFEILEEMTPGQLQDVLGVVKDMKSA